MYILFIVIITLFLKNLISFSCGQIPYEHLQEHIVHYFGEDYPLQD